ncbi:MAG TPA: TonB-dependent receptor [Terriglobia bacterium]|nr:TonB-dependent receptor [Terriglobia bacterium]
MNHRTLTGSFAISAVLFLTTVCSLSRLAKAQTVNGAFHGTVTDPTGAVLPGASVEAKNLATNAVRQSGSDDTGFYTIVQLPPGNYTLTASKTGFATAVQSNVQLLVNQDAELDFTLKVGAVSQTMDVTAAPPVLQVADATISQVIGSKQVVDLPLNGRQFTQLVLLTPGAAPKETGQQAFFVIPIGGGGISPSVNGQRGQQNNFTLDGVLNNAIFDNAWAISPPPDAIQEFNVQSEITDAQFSISSGANVNVVTKSGSNQFHGSVWEFIRNDKLDAANFFDNVANQKKPAFRQNQYGFQAGGPLMIPHLYDGRDKKTYVSGYWEGYRSSKGFTEFNNVPTAAELGGDFSGLLTNNQSKDSNGNFIFDALGRKVFDGQIYNPYSTRQVTAGQVDPVTGLVATSTGLVRDPFSGNIITGVPLNAQALTYLKAFYPLPNFGPGFPNFTKSSAQVISSDQFGIRVDHSFSNADTLYGNYYYAQPDETFPTSLLSGADVSRNHARVIALGYTHLFSPTLVGSFHYGYNKTDHSRFIGGTGNQALLDATGLGSFEPVRDGIPIVPQISLSPRLGGTGQFAIPLGPIRSHQFGADIQKIRGSHTLSVGAMLFHIHSFDDGWGSSIGFDQFPTAETIASGNVSSTGDGLASMLLNLPSSIFGFVGYTGADDKTNWQGYYVQDKWQASKKLIVQIGIRYDYVPPAHYKNDEVSGWNPECPVPNHVLTPQEQTSLINSCFLIPIPFPTPPGSGPAPNPSWPFPNVRKTYFDPKYNGWQPRLGFAYSANPKTVVRGAFTVFTDHNNTLVQESQDPRIAWPFGAGVSFGNLNHGLVSCPNASLSAGQTCFNNLPAASLFLPPNNYTPALAFGATPRLKIPYAMEYNVSVEREITPNLTGTVSYVGTGSRHLFIQPMYNAPLTLGPNAVAPFPFFGQFPWDTNSGVASYNSLQVKVQKRFSQGVTFLGSYTWSKCLSIQDEGQSGSIQNPYNWSADKGDCDFNIPHIFVFSYAYELPIGKGRHFGSSMSGVANAVLGGWQASGITTAESGAPFTANVGFDNAHINPSSENQRANPVPGVPLLPSGFKQTPQAWYNPAAFAVPPPYTYGTLGRNTLRGPKFGNWDFALMKNFQITESKTFQFRSEFFNVFNNVNFSPPGGGSSGGFSTLGGESNTSVGAPGFMQIFSAAAAREIQFSLKFQW